jgi:outer membrane immunogenic protein
MGTDVDWKFPGATATSTAATSQSFSNGLLGGHIGYQHQFGSLVLGVEAAGMRPFDSDDRQESACAFPAPFTDRCDTVGLHPMYTVGGRIGWTPVHRWLVYATGGYASSRFDTQIRFGGVGVPPPPNAAPVTHSTLRQDGWYVGGGIEYALTSNWLVGLEYQRIELEDKGHSVGGNCSEPSILNREVSGDIDVVRARISYKFDWGVAEPLK